uniref:exodeoxyribonuclease VII large subunit n=1 Tax=Candidatus Phytoplasma sp. AldY-WA1 TaxID=2852100 RepID=UPI00254AA482
ERIDEFRDKYKKNKLPLIKGYIKRNQKKNLVITSQKNDNQQIKITGPSFTREMIDQNIIIQSNLIYKYFYTRWTYKLEIINCLLIKNITEENCQKNIKAIKSDLKIGILTNETDALSDIEWELKKVNYKNYEFFKVRVQGNEAIDDICKMVKEVNDKHKCDIILLSRGGGDESEINNVFNNSDIITAIKNSKIPIVTAIGHAKNITFSDLVAFDNDTTPTSGIQKVLELIKFFDKAKNNYENHNDKLLDLYLRKINDYSLKKQNDLIQQKESLDQQKESLDQQKAELIEFQNTLTQKEESWTTAQNDLIQQKESLAQQKAELIKFQNTLTQKKEDLSTETQNYLIIWNRTVKIRQGIVYIEFSNENILIDIYNEDKNIIILNRFYLIKILNQYNFQIHFLYFNMKSNLNLQTKVLYLNKEELKTIDLDFRISVNEPTHYDSIKKLLFINRNITKHTDFIDRSYFID